MNTHFEGHVIRNPHEAELAEAGGLPHIIETEDCANCGSQVGPVDDQFKPLVMILNAEELFLLCMACGYPLTSPRN